MDLSATIIPKSDQMNSDDLIAGPLTIRITGVRGTDGEQPVAIDFEGDGGKPYKPCKSMRRVLVHLWGADAKTFAGRSLTLYRDAEVAFGGMKVGGIRISHASHIDAAKTMALTATRGNKRPFTVKPLVVAPPADAPLTPAEWLKALENELRYAIDANEVAAITARDDVQEALVKAKNGFLQRLKDMLEAAHLRANGASNPETEG